MDRVGSPAPPVRDGRRAGERGSLSGLARVFLCGRNRARRRWRHAGAPMITHESYGRVVVPKEPSLSRRVVSAVVKAAQRFKSDILFSAGDIRIDAKSTLMAFILLEALKGQPVDMTARGP